MGPSHYLTSAKNKNLAIPAFLKVYDDKDKLRLNDAPSIDVDLKSSYLDSVGLLSLSVNPYLHKKDEGSPLRKGTSCKAPSQTSYSLPSSPASVVTVEDSPAKPSKSTLNVLSVDIERDKESEADLANFSKINDKPCSSRFESTSAGDQPLPGVKKAGPQFAEAVEENEDQTSDSDSDEKSDNEGEDDEDDDDIITIISSQGSEGESGSETSRGASPVSVVSLNSDQGGFNLTTARGGQGSLSKLREETGTDNRFEDEYVEKVQMLASLNLMPRPVPCRKKSPEVIIESKSSVVATSDIARPIPGDQIYTPLNNGVEISAEPSHQRTELLQEKNGEEISSQVDRKNAFFGGANTIEIDCPSQHSDMVEEQVISKVSNSSFREQADSLSGQSLFQPIKTASYSSCGSGESEIFSIKSCPSKNDAQCESLEDVESEEMDVDLPVCYIDVVEEDEEDDVNLMIDSDEGTFGIMDSSVDAQEGICIDDDGTNTTSDSTEPSSQKMSPAENTEEDRYVGNSAYAIASEAQTEKPHHERQQIVKKSVPASICSEQTNAEDRVGLKENRTNSGLFLEDQNTICHMIVTSEKVSLPSSTFNLLKESHISKRDGDHTETISPDSNLTETSLRVKESTKSICDPAGINMVKITSSNCNEIDNTKQCEPLSVRETEEVPIHVSVDKETIAPCVNSISSVEILKSYKEMEDDKEVKDVQTGGNNEMNSPSKGKYLIQDRKYLEEPTAVDEADHFDLGTSTTDTNISLLSKPEDSSGPGRDEGSCFKVLPGAKTSTNQCDKNHQDGKHSSTDQICRKDISCHRNETASDATLQTANIGSSSSDKNAAARSETFNAIPNTTSLSVSPAADLKLVGRSREGDEARGFIAGLVDELVNNAGVICSIDSRPNVAPDSDQQSKPSCTQKSDSESVKHFLVSRVSNEDTFSPENDVCKEISATYIVSRNSDSDKSTLTPALEKEVKKVTEDMKINKNNYEICNGVNYSRSTDEKKMSTSSQVSSVASEGQFSSTNVVNASKSSMSESFEKATGMLLESKDSDQSAQPKHTSDKAEINSGDNSVGEKKSGAESTIEAEEERVETNVFEFITEICNSIIEKAAPNKSYSKVCEAAEMKENGALTKGERCNELGKDIVSAENSSVGDDASMSQGRNGNLNKSGTEANGLDGTSCENANHKKEGPAADTVSSNSLEMEELTIIEELSDAKGVRVSSRSKEEDREMVDALLTTIIPGKKEQKLSMDLKSPGHEIVLPASCDIKIDVEKSERSVNVSGIQIREEKTAESSCLEKETTCEKDDPQRSSSSKESEGKINAVSEISDVNGETCSNQSTCGEQSTELDIAELAKKTESSKSGNTSNKRKRDEPMLKKEGVMDKESKDDEDDDDITITSVEPADPPVKKQRTVPVGDPSYIADIISSVYHGFVPQRGSPESTQSVTNHKRSSEDNDDIIVVEDTVQPSALAQPVSMSKSLAFHDQSSLSSNKQKILASASYRPSIKGHELMRTSAGMSRSAGSHQGGCREPYTLMGKAPQQESQVPKIIISKPYIPSSLPPNTFREANGKGKMVVRPHHRFPSSGSRQGSFPSTTTMIANSKNMHWSPSSSSALGYSNVHPSNLPRNFDCRASSKSQNYKSNISPSSTYHGRESNKVYNSHLRKSRPSPQQGYFELRGQGIPHRSLNQVETPYTVPRGAAYLQHSSRGHVAPGNPRLPSASNTNKYVPSSHHSPLPRYGSLPQYGPPPRKTQKSLDGLKIILDENSDEEDSAFSRQCSRRRKSMADTIPKIVSVCSLNNPVKSAPTQSTSQVGSAKSIDAVQIVLSDSE